jgi:hypothetical protein
MGCATSSPADEPVEKHDNTQQNAAASDEQVRAMQQRRRLSVQAMNGEVDVSAKPTSYSEEVSTVAEGLNISKQFYQTAARSKKGFVPYNSRKQNQDAMLVRENLNGNSDISVYGVFDGHGEFGELVSGYCRDHLPSFLEQEQTLTSDPVAALLSATANLCSSLTRTAINRQFSGTTAVYGLRVGKKMFVANIGDSRCIIVRRGASGTLEVVALSYDHKPETPAEKARILRAGGRVQPLPGKSGLQLPCLGFCPLFHVFWFLQACRMKIAARRVSGWATSMCPAWP